MNPEEINYIRGLKRLLLYRFNERGKSSNCVMIESISDEEEEHIDSYTSFKRDDKKIINKSDIYFYGDIDLSNPQDEAIIYKYDFVDKNLVHSWIPSNFNHNTGIGSFLKVPTADALDWFKYCHCLLGKPNKVIVYRYTNKRL